MTGRDGTPLRIHPDTLILLASIAACVAVWALTPAPTFGPVQPARASAVAQRATPRTGPENDGRSTGVAVALLAAFGLAFWLIHEDLLRIGGDVLAATEGTES